MLARNAEFDFYIKGASAHGAQPQQGRDAVLAASAFVVGLNQIVSRFIDPLEPAVITTGTINGGEARNIIAGDVHVSGTMRAFDDETFVIMKQKMLDTAKAIELQYDVKIKDAIVDYYPAVYNDPELFKVVESALHKDNIIYIKPYTFFRRLCILSKRSTGHIFIYWFAECSKRLYLSIT